MFEKLINRKLEVVTNNKNYAKLSQLLTFLVTMNQQPSSFEGEVGWLANLWKGLKVESTIKI